MSPEERAALISGRVDYVVTVMTDFQRQGFKAVEIQPILDMLDLNKPLPG